MNAYLKTKNDKQKKNDINQRRNTQEARYSDDIYNI